MEIINNLTDSNHEEVLWYLLDMSSEFICCSPFLNKSVNLFESVYNKRIHLITTLKPNKAEQLEKVDYFQYLYDVARKNKLNLQISIDNHLHGKVYIGKNRESFISAIVTSANLTTAGMTENHEWGISIDDQQMIAKLTNQIEEAIEYPNVTDKDLLRFNQEIEKKGYDKKKLVGDKKINLQLVGLLDKKVLVLPYFASKKSRYWLKPLGSKEHPFSEDKVMTNVNQRLDFAKRPISISVGDIVICYGVGVRKILSVFKITKPFRAATNIEKKKNKNYERWNWCVESKNMTRVFGGEWSKHELTLSRLGKEYLKLYPGKKLTTHSQSLGALRYHADKLELSEEFAFFIIGKVMDKNG